MANVPITVPGVGESISEGILARWLKSEGEPVKAGEPLFELETDKASNVVPAPADGILKITAVEGTTVEIGDLRGRPFILAEPGTALRETVVAATQAAGFSPLPLFEVGDPATVRYLVRANLGLAIVPASWLERPGPVVGAADLVHAPCHRLSLLTPAAGASPSGRLLHERLLEL